jgi:hypothetical protein
MLEDIPIGDLDRGEHRLILRDIASWKFELGRDNNDPDREPAEYINEATELSDAALVRHWYDTVGEWILSRHDVRKPPTIDSSMWLDAQLGRLLFQGVETDYGFLSVVNLSAVLEDDVGVDREDGRNLYPDDHRHEGYAPDGWTVYEKIEHETHHLYRRGWRPPLSR